MFIKLYCETKSTECLYSNMLNFFFKFLDVVNNMKIIKNINIVIKLSTIEDNVINKV